MNRVLAGSLACAGGLCLAGCVQGGLEETGFQARVIESAEPDAVFQAAEVVLRREFGRLTLDRQKRTIVSQPVEFKTASESGTARDLVRADTSMRRTATFSVAERGGQTVARLRIDVDRQDTARRGVIQPESYRLSDSPAYTPIERDAATTERQNTVWTYVRRDRRLERGLLEELQAYFAPRETGPSPASDESPAESTGPASERADDPGRGGGS